MLSNHHINLKSLPGLIAFYVPSFRGGGAEKAWVHIANQFVANGFQVDFIVAQSEGPYRGALSSSIRIVDFRTSNILSTIPLLTRYLRDNKPLILLSALNHTNLVSLLAKKISFSSTKNVISVQNYLSLHAQNSTSIKDKIIPFLARVAYPFSKYIVAVSNGVADDLSNISGISIDKINIICNPVVMDELSLLSKQPVNHEWFKKDQVPVIIGIGRFVKQKNFSLLIKAFSVAKKKIPSRLIILGEGEERTQLQHLINDLGISDCVSLPGFVQNPYNYIANSSLFVLSSLWEGFGNVVVEALACGTSVVSTDCKSGPAEILENGTYGKLVPINDVDKLADAIVETLQNPFDPSLLISRAHHYSAEQIFSQYYKLLFSD